MTRPLKVLLVSLFHPELVRGGAQQICYELFEGLRAQPNVEPVLLAAIEPRFAALYKSGARITGFDNRPDEYLFLSRNYDFLWHRTTDPLLVEAYVEFLEMVRPDVVHFHHFLLFGVNMFAVTRRVLPHAKLIFTFHEFLSICAADGHMVRLTDRTLCTRASNVRCHQCLPDRGPEQFFMRELWMKRHLAVMDCFTTPSRFMIEPYVTWGLERSRIRHVTNGQRNYGAGRKDEAVRTRRNRFGFFGQLVDNKGVWLLLQAAQLLRAEGFEDFVVEINGDNLIYASEARRNEIEAVLAAELERPLGSRNIIMNGAYHMADLPARMGRVDWCVVPSTWWEIFGLVISEAAMFGRPVIATDVGGPRERIRHDIDGLLFALGDARALAETIRRAVTEDGLWQRLHDNIREPAGRDVMVEGFMALYHPDTDQPFVVEQPVSAPAPAVVSDAPPRTSKRRHAR